MERRVLYQRDGAHPAGRSRAFLHDGAHPRIRAFVHSRKLVESERLADPLAQLVRDDLELPEQPRLGSGITDRVFEAAISFLPFLTDSVERDHERRMLEPNGAMSEPHR